MFDALNESRGAFVVDHMPGFVDGVDPVEAVFEVGKRIKAGEDPDEVDRDFDRSMAPSKNPIRITIFDAFERAEDLIYARADEEKTPEDVAEIKDRLGKAAREAKKSVASAEEDMKEAAQLSLREPRAAIKIATSDVEITREQALASLDRSR